MYPIIAAITILAALCLVHLKYGPGCWGLQPGGRWTARLFDLQTVVSLGAMVYSFTIAFRERTTMSVVFVLLTLALAAAAAWQFRAKGWRMHTSIHNQGPENLPTFLLTSSVALVCGIYIMLVR